ncbi:MAG: DegQ family serine endoprotease [Candidatus Neomarinimicrobiota bacterium]
MRNRIVFIVTILIGFIYAQNSIVDQFSQALADIAEQANPAVVTITTEKVISGRNPYHGMPFEDFFNFQFEGPEYHGTALGSGVVVDAGKGYILTNNHVVEGADKIEVHLLDKRIIEAEMVGTDPKSDLAVLKIKAKDLVALKLGDSDKLRVGEWVMAVGSPFSANLSHSVTAGIVSAMGRSNIINAQNYEDFIQTDAAINPGNSGGALLNMRGELVGINTAIATGGIEKSNSGVGFAIPSNMARKVMRDLIEHGYVVRSYIGVGIQNVDDAVAKAVGLDQREGALVGEVMENSPAAKSDLRVGDVIIAFNGTRISSTDHLRNLVSSTPPGDKSKIEIVRDGKHKTVSVVLEELADKTQQLASRQEPEKSELGMNVQNLTRALAERYDIDPKTTGAVITYIERGSPAARAGLRPGDVIIKVGSQDITDAEQFRQVSRAGQKDALLLLIKRGESTRFYPLEMN